MKHTILKLTATTLTAALLSTTAYGAIWDITGVHNGTDSGFGFSEFHSAEGNMGMNGALLFDIEGVAAYADVSALGGTYNDTTGVFNISGLKYLHSGTNSSTFDLIGTLSISGTNIGGVLNTFLNSGLDFGSSSLVSGGYNVGFQQTQVCCSGINPPNTFIISGNTAILSLWGNTMYTTDNNGMPIENHVVPFGEGFGMDIRFELEKPTTETPEPSMIGMMLGGLGLVGFAAYRRK